MIKKLMYSLGLCLGTGGIGLLFTAPSINNWYILLNRPLFTPPNWIFGPVWTVLYIMMGVSLYIVWAAKVPLKGLAYVLFATQLALNAGWSAIFFGLHSIGGGLLVIVGLWISVAATIRIFRPLSRVAAWLLVPYWVWVSFAMVLNYAFWRLNQ